MSTITLRDQRARIAADAVISAYINELGLAEREHVRLGAGLEERDLQGPFADRTGLAHELVQAAVPEQAVPVVVDIHAMRGAGRLAVQPDPEWHRLCCGA